MAGPSTDSDESLSALYMSCLQKWGIFLMNLRAEDCQITQLNQVDVNKTMHEYARVKIWGDQTKAHLPPRARGSLDDTLRHDLELKKTVESMLLRMSALLDESINIAKRKSYGFQDSDYASLSSVSADSEDESEEENEEDEGYGAYRRVPKIQLLLQYTYQQVDSLFDLSNLLRRPSVAGKWIRSNKKISESEEDDELSIAYKEFDLNHILEKVRFWRALSKDAKAIAVEDETAKGPGGEENPFEGLEDLTWLCERLAQGCVRRREQLEYWVRRPYNPNSFKWSSPKLPKLPEKPRSRPAGTAISTRSEVSTARQSQARASTQGDRTVSRASKTSFSTAALSEARNAATEPDRPRTVYAPTMAGGKSTNSVPKAPKIPEGLNSVPCPYCGMSLKADDINSRQRWKRHVFRDLRPYVCTFEDCQNHGKLYVSRNDWIYHELQMHRRQHVCSICDRKYERRKQLADHLNSFHKDSISPAQLSVVLDLSNRQMDDTEQDSCLFCGETMSLLALQSHLAGHMEDLSLFALRPSVSDTDDLSQASVAVGSRESEKKKDDEESEASADSTLRFSDDGGELLEETGDTVGASSEVMKQLENEEPEMQFDAKVSTWNKDESKVEDLAQEQGGVSPTQNDNVPQSSDLGMTEASSTRQAEDLNKAEDGSESDDAASPTSEIDIGATQELGSDMGDAKKAPEAELPPLSAATAELIEATKAGELPRVQEALENGADLEGQEEDFERTALLWAAERGHEEITQLLIDSGANIQALDMGGQTPLSLAARNGHTAAVKALLEAGAEVDVYDEDFGQTPLSWASERGYTDVVRLLLEKGSNPEWKDEDFQQSCLSLAAENGHIEIIEMLLEKGADPQSKDTGGRTPLSWAASNGHEEAVRLLRKYTKGKRR